MEPTSMERVLLVELTLLDPQVRTDRDALGAMLDPEFSEIGQSGRFWTRDEIISDLPDNDQAEYGQAEATDFRFVALAEGCYLVTYLLEIEEQRSRRSSIWREREGELAMVFHQGTPTP
ncbi:MAG: DUF4440 domain-containing protein [Thermomicrobiales bacterium]|nr:MAG: DUF4440 domain-containing protein [Thermomicrobiales bacterium]